jgi:glycosyltransferase involved in cell wall biosynthesis
VERASIICEVSRTDHTKRKDVLIRAFAHVRSRFPDTLLAVTIDKTRADIYEPLIALVQQLELSEAVAVLGSISEYVPSLYGVSQIYCTPSIMEGFGMSIQEAAACGVPAVASGRVPFAVEYLLGRKPEERVVERDGTRLLIGPGAIVAEPDSVAGIAAGLETLLADDGLRQRMGRAAYGITIPAFTWERATREFLQAAEVPIPRDVVTAGADQETGAGFNAAGATDT